MSVEMIQSRTVIIGRVARSLLVIGGVLFLVWLVDRHVVFRGTLKVPFHQDASSPYVQLALPGRRPLSAIPSAANPFTLMDGRLDIVLQPPRTFQTANIQFTVSSCVDLILSGPAPVGTGTEKDVEFFETAVTDAAGCLATNPGVRVPLDWIGNDGGKYHLTLKPAHAGDQITLTGIAITFEGQPITWAKIVNWLKKS